MKVISGCAAAALSISSLPFQSALADPLPPVWVEERSDDTSFADCNLTYASAAAAAEAALRYNRTAVATKDDYYADRAIALQIDLIAYEITRKNGDRTGTCAISLGFFIGTHTKTFDPVHKDVKWATVHYCDDASLFTLDKLNTQKIVNDKIAEYTNKCLSEYAKLTPG